MEMNFCDGTLKRCDNVLDDVWGFVVNKKQGSVEKSENYMVGLEQQER